MYIKNINLLFLTYFFTCINIYAGKSYNFLGKSYLVSKISFQIIQNKDSISLDSLYRNAYHFYNQEKYPDALKNALIIFNISDKTDNHNLTSKSAELIGEIYDKTSNIELSLKYFKISLKKFIY